MNGRGQNNGRNQSGGLSGGPVVLIFKGLASGVGLASESIQHHKEKKRTQKQQVEQQKPVTTERVIAPDDLSQSEVIPKDYNEEEWQLDDAQEELSRDTYQSHSPPATPEKIPALADNFIRDKPMPVYPESSSQAARLPLPIVLTQRRPKARDRGFIKAYAPILEDVGIDQEAFLDFIDKLNKAVEPSPWIQAINLAGFAAQHVPLAVSMAISVALKLTADAASEVHSRSKTNSFLDKINQEYFMPRGTIAIIMTWKPQDPAALTTVNFDLGATVADASTGGNQGAFLKFHNRMKSSSAATSFEFPETAPLIFPTLDKLVSSKSNDPNTETKKENIVKRGGGFVGDYLDRRAVAQWAGENPNSTLANAAPKPEFRSRYADPNHPASSGDPLAFITGGKISSDVLRQTALGGGTGRGFDRGGFGRGGLGLSGFGRGSIMEGRYAGMEWRGLDRGVRGTRGSEGSDPRVSYGGQGCGAGSSVDQSLASLGGGIGGSGLGPLSLISGVKKLLQKDVLYLMVVSLPTEMEKPVFVAESE
ncbi:hypothetical protein VPNG_06101 [Cytospora leucostoma]|uniref:Uncharacterized protein n=1 Tax=Cytospora leucostoma TaxID=1230097 RepID=A0A423WX32_9PEZI|nr:hypothetical protein VPNG_06101 [Cytospora leucostoma]